MNGTLEINKKLSSLLHTTITACNTFSKGCGEPITESLSKTIQSLLKYATEEPNSLPEFNEENRLAIDCIMSILALTGQVPEDIASDILKLLIVLASCVESCQLLDTLGIINSVLLILNTESHPLQTMALLSKLTQKIELSGHESYMDSLLQRLINNVLSNDVTLKYSLSTLVNLSTKNLSIQMQIRSLDRSSSLRRAIRRLVSHDDTEVSITALAAMTSTGMSEEFNKIVNSDKNLDQLLKLSFSIILTVRKSESFPYAVKVLVNLINNRKVQQFLLNNCSQLESFMSKAVSLLTTCDSNQLSKLFELLLALASVPGLRIILTKLIFAPVRISEDSEHEQELLAHVFHLAKRPVTSDSQASAAAIQFIIYIYEALALDPALAGSTCHLDFQFLTECLKQNDLDNKRQLIRMSSSEKTIACLQLLEVLVSSDAFSANVLSEVEPDAITDIIDYQIRNNPVCLSWNSKAVDSMSSNVEQQKAIDQCSLLGVEIVLRSMSVLIEATERNESYLTCLDQYIQKTALLPFIAGGLTSSRTELVQLSLKLVMRAGSTNALPVTVLSDVLANLNHKQATQSQSCPSIQTPKLKTVLNPDNKENVIMGSPAASPRFENFIPSSQASEVDIAEKLASLQVGGDSHVSDIISVYELKLKAQKTRETHLDDLVQAKTMALSQADRLIQQYKSRLSQTDAETHKLRSIVHESERRSESYREKMNEMLIDRERLQNELERLQQDSQKLEDTQRALSSVKRELDTLTEIHTTLTNFTDNLKQQHRELESDYSVLKESERKKSVSITELEAKIVELQKQKAKLEEQYKKLTQEKTTIKEQHDNLKAQNLKLEKTLKQKEEKLRVIFETLK